MNLDTDYLRHIQEAIDNIRVHRGAGDALFTINRAIVFELVIIGEAVRKLSDETKRRYPDVPWSKIVGARNILVHEYDGIDYEATQDIVENHLPFLEEWIQGILRDMKEK